MKNQETALGKEGSFWLEMCPATHFPTLEDGLKVDVAILGGALPGSPLRRC